MIPAEDEAQTGDAASREETILARATEPDSEQLAFRMGIKITDLSPERVVATMPVAGNRQPYGLLHGGANAVLAEFLGSVAATLNAGADRFAVGLELSCTHHRAVDDGTVTGIATPLHQGNTTASYAIGISDEQGRLTCSARLTCILRDGTP